ncbi:MAG: hypothetical protein K0S33_2799 [Bacteroidetes bacterium]|jgi:hypothetical protein|nr:hypothetical protein [Bacteroidota bacterium]
MKKVFISTLLICSIGAFAQKPAGKAPATKQPAAKAVVVSEEEKAATAKKAQDREAILSLAGCHTVTFKFAETFSPIADYKYHDRYFESGTEFVAVIENSENKIVLQHLLVVNDSMIIKHWRQDWLFENTELLKFVSNDKWEKITLSKDQVKGQWTQKVGQVDDSPRYEGTATWVHVDGNHYWESVADAPLPRREYTKRSDYNVLKRDNKIILTKDGGWLHEQDNQKLVRKEGKKDSLLCWEKGIERFTDLPEGKCIGAIKWWDVNKNYWNDVRAVWQNLQSENTGIALALIVDNMKLYEALFKLGEQQTKANADSPSNQKIIKETIVKYFKV